MSTSLYFRNFKTRQVPRFRQFHKGHGLPRDSGSPCCPQFTLDQLQIQTLHVHMLQSKAGMACVGVESDQHVNICSFAVRCDQMWPNTQ